MSPSLRYTISMLKKYLKPYIWQVIILTLILITYNAIQIFNPQILRFYIESATGDEYNLTSILIAAIIYIALSLVFRGLYILVQYISQNLAWSTTNDLRMDLTRHCINLDMTFHNHKKTGEMIERIDGDASSLSEFFSTFSIYFFGSILLLIGVLIAVFIEGWIYGLIFLIFTIIAVIGLYFVRQISSPLWKKVRESTTALFGTIEESISGLEDVRSNGADTFIMNRFHDISQQDFKNKFKAMFVSRTYYAINITMAAILNLAILLISYYVIGNGGSSIDPSVLFLLLTYGTNILWPLRLILWQLEQMQNSLANIDRINEFFEIESKIKDEGKEGFPDKDVNLSFKNLDFSYDNETYVLKNINLNIPTGRKLGLVGKTGSGKTTIARLIFRLYDPQKGHIAINGTYTNDIKLAELRKHIAYVTQEVELFKASIRDNITLFNKEIHDEKIINVLHEIGLQEWFEKLPNGLDTEIFSEELGLSAGEEQLLTLTRAFLKNPKIVILDEASSRLDPATERYIDLALDKLLENRSAIIIAHRLATLHKVDDIMLLQKGEIVEYDSREKLVKNPNSHYSQLLKKGIEEVLQ
ncbi:MAG: ABC transporter ATP-binding protein [Asgard group archaeon]|nr:ABC transporter ATP-binding protein [Asgard group archaeon]